MNTSRLLDQLLKSGTDLLKAKTPANPSESAGSVAGITHLLSGKAGAALGGGALGLLLGNKKARKYGGKAAMYGGLAALGVMAYKAYGNWQQQSQSPVPQAQPQTLDRLQAPEEIETHSRAILAALIAAAKADGHIDAGERALIDQELARQGADIAEVQWVDQQLQQPLDPHEIARWAQTPEMAVEMYLASLLMIDQQSYMEKVYLDALAKALKLAPDLVLELEQQVVQNS